MGLAKEGPHLQHTIESAGMNLKDLCRLLLCTELSNRQVGSALRISHNTALRYRTRLAEEELSWQEISRLSDADLEARLNQGRQQARKRFVEPDFAYVHEELRKTAVTIMLLYEEYAASTPSGVMSETEFRRRYARYQRSIGLVMRQPRQPGYQLFLDYSGKRPSVTDPLTGEQRPVELFVAVMGASRKTFVYATKTQRLHDWCEANVRALEFFGGVPAILVPDNLKSAVDRITKSTGAIINHTFSELAQHYDTVVVPARPRKPKDKAPVEIGVLLVQRWILARLRHQVFYSLGDLNEEMAMLLQQMNNKPMRTQGGKSRNQLFDELDRPALKPLPERRYEFAEWRLNVIVSQDYHVSWDDHHYSVPYRLVGERVRLRVTATLIEVFHKHENFPVASHLRSHRRHGSTTNHEHQPAKHKAYSMDRLDELMLWAARSGGSINQFAQLYFEHKRRPLMLLRALQGMKSMAREYGVERLDAACKRAIIIKATSPSSIRSMLERRLETAPVRGYERSCPMPSHENVRGPDTYQ